MWHMGKMYDAIAVTKLCADQLAQSSSTRLVTGRRIHQPHYVRGDTTPELTDVLRHL